MGSEAYGRRRHRAAPPASAMNGARLGGGVIALGVAALWAGGAQAQAQAQAAAPSTDRFMASLTGAVNYDSNIAGGNDQAARIRGISPSDTTYLATATVDTNWPMGSQSAFLRGSATARRHQDNKNLDGEDFLVNGGLSKRFGPCVATGGASYSRQQTPPSELVVLIAKNTVEEQTYNLGASCQRGRIVTSVSAQYSEVDGGNASAGFRNSQTTDFTGGVGYLNEVLGTIQLSAQYSKVSYDDAPGFTPAADSGFHQFGGGLNYSRKIGNRLNGRASITYMRVEPGIGSSFGAWSGDGALNYRFSTRLQFALQYARGVQAAQLAEANSVLTSSVRFSGTYALSRRINLVAGVSQDESKYRGLIGPSPFVSTNDQLRSAFASASMTLGRSTSISLDVSHYDRESNNALFSSQSDHVGISLTKSF